MDANIVEFEDKTENNFKIADKAIKSHVQFINEIDARITYEELINRACFEENDHKLRAVHGELTDKFQQQSEQTVAMLAAAQAENLKNFSDLKNDVEQQNKEFADTLNEKLDTFKEETDKKVNDLQEKTENEVGKFFLEKEEQ